MGDDENGVISAGEGEVGDGEHGSGGLSEEEKDFRDFSGVSHDAKPDPSWDNRRFRQIYRKAKDSERSAEELKSDIKAMAEHNRKLAEAAERITSSTEKLVQKESDTQTSAAQIEIEKLEDSIKSLKSERKAARTEYDWDKVDEIEDQIQKLDKKLDKKRDEAEAALEKAKEKKPDATPPLRPDMAAIKEFVTSTDWYNPESDDFDPVMASAAKEYDAALMQKSEYKGKIDLTSDRLKKVKDYIEKRFSYKKENGNGKDKRSPVEGVGNEGAPDSHRSNNTTLTADQKRIAHMMLDDSVGAAKAEAEYLKQLRAIGGVA